MLSSIHIILLIVEMTFYLDYLRSNRLVWVQHHSDLAAHGLWWQVVREVASNSASVTMWTHNLAPLYSEPGVIDGGLNFLNVTNFLS